MMATHQRTWWKGTPRLGATALLLGVTLTGCAVTRAPGDAADKGPARLGDGGTETAPPDFQEPSGEAAPGEGTITVPKSVWNDLQKKALAADAPAGPPRQEAFHAEALFGGAVRWYTGGDIAEIVEPWSLGIPLRVYLDLPHEGPWGVGVFLLGSLYDVPIKHSEMYWSARSVGGGFRLHYAYADAGNIYFQLAGAYAYWEGREDDRPTHPNFNKRTIFRSDGFGRIEPRDVEGSEIGIGVGTTRQIGETVGISSELNFRHQEGTDKWAGEWVEWVVGLNLRF